MTEEIRKKLEEADMVLVGIGEEFAETDFLTDNPLYRQTCNVVAEAGAQWVMPYVNRFFMKEDSRLHKAYRAIANLLNGKNYYVISTCMDGMIADAGLREERVVEPCGTCFKMQCKNGCPGSVQQTDEMLFKEAALFCEGRKKIGELALPVCACCGEPMVYNSLYAEQYLEEGYRDKWELYTKWLQGTVNRKLCILELGSGMMFAGVLRFRFEKIVGLNQKAELIRIHQNLYQLPEEIGGRGCGISQNAVEFMAQMEEM